MADMAEIDIKEEAKKILSEFEFVQRLQDLVTEAVAQAINRVNEAAEARIASLETELSSTKNRLEEAERRIEDLDAYNRRTSLLITGVPETSGEATDNLVLDVGRAAGLNLSADNLDRSHRLGRPQPGKVRPIIAKFATTNARQKLFDKRKELTAEKVGGHPVLTRSVISRIFVSECLTAKNQQLFFLARQLRKRKSLWAAYTTNGCVRVKKTEGDIAVSIREPADLEDIVGADAFRELRPRETEPARSARRGSGPAWQAADAINAWVTERRRGRSPAVRGD
ncbi:hypothetical protein FJT64_022994 [Amphibalanus amphitrite]|uniref:LINE-1 type transposase domain-containing protein 1 n=1 Tax=Amphibalanus amphitrite TaxID=1232801 RepID=A0A6A4WDC7_AMPAM|nr:hypothetical protein FJT64_022994 [Amphibalanus amphitrite]